MRTGWLVAVIGGLFLGLAQPAAAQPRPGDPFENWAAVVIAGDWHAHSGGPSEAFDNARHDVGQALQRAGFEPANLREYSVRPDRYRDPRPEKTDLNTIYADLSALTARTSGGCLFYLSSHGSPGGAIVDDRVLTPGVLGEMLDRTCGKRPTIVVISACFSGVYVPTLASNTRMILTAARPDRTSFGCGEEDRYPYFDDCFLKSMKAAHDFPSVAHDAQACVARKELATGAQPPSDPQLFIGGALLPILPLLDFPS